MFYQYLFARLSGLSDNPHGVLQVSENNRRVKYARIHLQWGIHYATLLKVQLPGISINLFQIISPLGHGNVKYL